MNLIEEYFGKEERGFTKRKNVRPRCQTTGDAHENNKVCKKGENEMQEE